MTVMAGNSKSEKRNGSGVIGVVVDLSVVMLVVVVVVFVVVDNVDAVVVGNLSRLVLKGGDMSFGLFLREAEKLAFFAGLKDNLHKYYTRIKFLSVTMGEGTQPLRVAIIVMCLE